MQKCCDLLSSMQGSHHAPVLLKKMNKLHNFFLHLLPSLSNHLSLHFFCTWTWTRACDACLPLPLTCWQPRVSTTILTWACNVGKQGDLSVLISIPVVVKCIWKSIFCALRAVLLKVLFLSSDQADHWLPLTSPTPTPPSASSLGQTKLAEKDCRGA